MINSHNGELPQGPSIRDVMRQGIMAFRRAGVPDPTRDARILMAEALGVETARITLLERDDCDPAVMASFDAMVVRRMGREPVARILGRREFYGRQFEVTPYVLDPRPETECLIEHALSEPFDSFLDVGTGSGCIAVTLLCERKNLHGIGTDISGDALQTAQRNAEHLGVVDRIQFEVSDWFRNVGGAFDLIISNPPYIHPNEILDLAPEVEKFDPKIALFDTDDGLTSFRRLAAGAMACLAPGGRLLVEIGHSQGPAVEAIFKDVGLVGIELFQDLDGRDRVVLARNIGGN